MMTILLVCLLWHSYLLRYGCSFSLSLYPLWHAPNGFNSSLLLLGGMSSQQDISPQKSVSRNPRIGFPLSSPPNHTLLPLTYDPPPLVLVGEVWTLRVLDFCVSPKLACCVCSGLEAPLHILSPILDFLWLELLSDSLLSMAHSL